LMDRTGVRGRDRVARGIGRLLEVGVWTCLGSIVAYRPILTDRPAPGFGFGIALVWVSVIAFAVGAAGFVAARHYIRPGVAGDRSLGASSILLGAASALAGGLTLRDRSSLSSLVDPWNLGASPEVAICFGVAGFMVGVALLGGERLGGLSGSAVVAGAAGLWILELDNLGPWVERILGRTSLGPPLLIPALGVLGVLVASVLPSKADPSTYAVDGPIH
jgi:hypothetical protein